MKTRIHLSILIGSLSFLAVSVGLLMFKPYSSKRLAPLSNDEVVRLQMLATEDDSFAIERLYRHHIAGYRDVRQAVEMYRKGYELGYPWAKEKRLNELEMLSERIIEMEREANEK